VAVLGICERADGERRQAGEGGETTELTAIQVHWQVSGR
jgi:hypothetical protein